MGEIFKGIAEFLRLNSRTAFALFAAGVSLWALVRFGIVTRDLAELGIAYLTCFGLFVWLGHLIQVGRRSFNRSSSRKQASASAAARQAEETAQRARDIEEAKRIAVENLKHMKGPEAETVTWMHRNQQYRIRTSNHFEEITNLVEMGILVVEDKTQPRHDRFFVMPEHVREAVAGVLGDPVPREGKPPWETRERRGWMV